MNNIILNIVSKKENLSYPLVFKKIGKYYWNLQYISSTYNMSLANLSLIAVKNKWYRVVNSLLPIAKEYILWDAKNQGELEVVKYLIEKNVDDIEYIECIKRALENV